VSAPTEQSHEVANPRGLDINLRSGPQLEEYKAIVDRIARDAPGKVLDWGCGWGHITTMLRERGVTTEAFDYNEDEPEPVKRVIDSPYPIEAWLSPDPVKLPFADGEFDAVLSLGVLEHVQDPNASLVELRRVLRPGGRLYVYKLPNRYSYLEWIAKKLGYYYHGALPYDRLYDKRTAVGIVRANGFEVDEFKRTNLLPLTLAHPLVQRLTPVIWALNRALRYFPGLSFLATNVELVATRR
jgi:2-polyprenyl-3-methyl-5-hydroxy-6-metoxy-1,4-benzoquinol methylase